MFKIPVDEERRFEALKLAVQTAVPGTKHEQILLAAGAYESWLKGAAVANQVGDSSPAGSIND